MVFIFLHVLAMFIAIAVAYGPAFLMVAAGNNVVALRGIMAANEKLGPATSIAFGVGLVFGIIAIFTANFDPLQGWLVIAYVLFAASATMAVLVTTPWLKKVAAAAATSPDSAPSPELKELLSGPRYRTLLALDALIIVALIADMVFKPLPGKLF